MISSQSQGTSWKEKFWLNFLQIVAFSISEKFHRGGTSDCKAFQSLNVKINSCYCVPYNSCKISDRNLVLDQPINIFLYSNHMFAWYCIDIVRKNPVLNLWLMGVKQLINSSLQWPSEMYDHKILTAHSVNSFFVFLFFFFLSIFFHFFSVFLFFSFFLALSFFFFVFFCLFSPFSLFCFVLVVNLS